MTLYNISGVNSQFNQLVDKLGVCKTEDRTRMIQNEGVLCHFVGSRDHRNIQKLQDMIGNATNSEILQQLWKNSQDNLMYIGSSDCYVIPEKQKGDFLFFGGYNQDYLGFVSLRKDGTENKYSLLDSQIMGERLLTSLIPGCKPDIFLVVGNVRNDIFAGKTDFYANGTSTTPIRINKDNRINKDSPHIHLNMLGEHRKPKMRGGYPDYSETYHTPGNSYIGEFDRSDDSNYMYQITGFVGGFD